MKLTRRVMYLENGETQGRAPVDPLAYVAGDRVFILGTEGALFREGYVFAEWNTNADGSGTPYQPGDQVIMGSADGYLYAIWVAESIA